MSAPKFNDLDYWDWRGKQLKKRIKRRGSKEMLDVHGIDGLVVRYEHCDIEPLITHLESSPQLDGDTLLALTYLLRKYAPPKPPAGRPIGSKGKREIGNHTRNLHAAIDEYKLKLQGWRDSSERKRVPPNVKSAILAEVMKNRGLSGDRDKNFILDCAKRGTRK